MLLIDPADLIREFQYWPFQQRAEQPPEKSSHATVVKRKRHSPSGDN